MSLKQTKVFNESCSCSTINQSKLEKIQEKIGGGDTLFDFQKYFASSPTSISKSSISKIKLFLTAFQEVLANPNIFAYFLKDINPKFKNLFPTKVTGGLFLGFDFHDTDQGPKLIEINTNAGGLLINSILYEVQEKCCTMLYCNEEISNFSRMKERISVFFENEWNNYFPDKVLNTVVILDEDPKNQFLYPEFKIFQNILNASGKKVFICSPDELQLKEEGIYYLEYKVDFIYNRHTDFLLNHQSMADILQTWSSGNVCLSPNPIDYMLYANKSNLRLLSDRTFLEEQGIEKSLIDILTDTIPETHLVTETEKEFYWGKRKHIFFKPQNGFASKGVYAGRKITKSKFDEITKLDYLAQEEVPPSIRTIHSEQFKIDYRAYVYDFDMLMLASRLYQGQTTNFRTEGGGFSPVMEIG